MRDRRTKCEMRNDLAVRYGDNKSCPTGTQLQEPQDTVWEEVEECIRNVLCYKRDQSSNPASILTAPLSEQGRGRGYEREIKLIKGLKGAIYEKSLREMNM